MVQGLTGGGTSGTSSPAFLGQVYNNLGHTFPVSRAGIQAAINDLPTANARTGKVYMPSGTIAIDADLTIGKRTYLIGVGPEATILQASANMTNGMVVIDPTNVSWTDWGLENLQLDLNSKNGAGIYCTHADQTGLASRMALHNLRIYNGAATYTGIELTDVRHMDARLLRIYFPGGTGIKLRTSNTYSEGESLWDNIIIGGLGTNDTVGLDIAGGGGGGFKAAANLSMWNRLQVGGVTSYGTGTRAVKIVDDWDIAFYNLHCEGAEISVYIEGTAGDYSENIDFFHPVIINSGADANNVCWHFENRVRTCNIFGGYCAHATGGKGIYANHASTWANMRPTTFWGHKVEVTGGNDGTITVTNNGTLRLVNGTESAINGNYLEYQTSAANKGATTPTGPVWNGRLAMVSCLDGHALFQYSNGGWHYTAVTA